MNKKVIYAVIAIAVIVVLVLVGVSISKKPNNNQNIDLATLNTEIKAKGEFDKMATMTIDKQIAKDLFEIEESQIEEIIGEMPMMNVHASMFVVIKATEGNVNNVKEKIDSYANNYEEQWSRYLPAQYELVQNRKTGTIGNFAYLIICGNAEEVETLIKK